METLNGQLDTGFWSLEPDMSGICECKFICEGELKKRWGHSLKAFPLRSWTEANTHKADYVVSSVWWGEKPGKCLDTEVMPTPILLNVG